MQHRFIKKDKVYAVAAAWLTVAGCAVPVLAQPDADNAPKGANVPTLPGPVKGMQAGAQQREQKMRELMANFGVADAPIQDAVIAYMASEAQAQRPLRVQGRKLFEALTAQAADANAITDDQMSARGRFSTALEADQDRTTEAEAALDEKIGYSKNPRLEAMLILLGIIGNGPPMMMAVPGQPNGPGLGGNANNAGLTPKERKERREALLKQFDKNGDGKLSPSERAAANAFAQAQKNAGAAAPAPQQAEGGTKPAAKDAENGAPVEAEGPEVQTPTPAEAPNAN